MIKWMYKESVGVLGMVFEVEVIPDHFTQDRPVDSGKFVHITFHQAISMIGKAKESVKEESNGLIETEIKEETKPEEAKIDCSDWTRQKCDSFLKKNDQPIPEKTGVDAGRDAVKEYLIG